MKTYLQFNESIGKALVKLGSVGLRKLPKYLPKFKSKLPKSITKLSKAKNIDKFETKVYNAMYNNTKFGEKPTQAWTTKSELGRNLIAKNKIKHKSPEGFSGTAKPLPTDGGVNMRADGSAGEIQLQGALKGSEYKRKLSGAGDKHILGSIGGSRGKGNRALRRSGQSDKITDYEGTGRKPTPLFRKTKAELSTVAKTPGSSKVEPHKWNPGDNYMLSVDIKQSKAKSRAIRNQLKVQQRREASLKNDGKGMEKEIEAMKKRLSGN